MPPTILSVKPRQEDLPDAPPPKKPIQNKRFKLPLVIGALVLLCAVGVAAVLAFKEQKPSTPSKTPVTTADTTKLAQVTPPPVGTTQLNVTELTAQNSELINLLAQALQVSKDLSVQGGVSVAGNVTAASLSGSGSGLTGVDATLLDGEPSSYFSTLAGNASQAVAQLQANAALLAFPNTFAANNTFSANLKVNGTATISSLVLGSPLTTTNGGTGLSTVPAGAVLYGQGGPVLGVATPSGIGDCLMSGVGSVTWGPCVSGTGAVASLDGLGGILTLANSSGSGNTITIDNASSAAKGIASFNATDFSVVNGAVDTAQPISVTATPTFGGLTLGAALTVANGGTGATSLTANGVVLGAGTGPLTVVTAGSGGQCLVSTAGAPVFQACPGAINVSSLNSLTGAITIANATTAGSTITLNNAKADGATKGIAAFNATNFTDNGSGIINTTQDIAVTSTPTFAGITVNGQGHINTNSVTAFNVEQNGVHNNVLTVDTTNGLVGINQTPQSGIALTVNGTNQSGNFLISSGANGNYLAKNYTVGTGGVSQNDVVVLVNDAGNSRVIDTTTARDIRVMGVSHTTTGAGNPAQIVFGGNTNVTADTGAVAIGDQLVTSGTSGQVMADNSATTGIVGYATSAKAGGSSGLVGIYVHVVNGVSNPNFSGNVTIQGAAGLNLGSASNTGVLKFLDGTGDGFNATIQLQGALASNKTFNLPTTGGNLCTDVTASCGGSYIINGASQQTANFNISGSGTAATSFLAPLFDTATAGALAVGTTNATGINLNQNTTIASGKSLTLAGTAYDNVNSTTALNIEQNGVHNNVFTVDTTNGAVGINMAPVAGVGLDITGSILSTNTIQGSNLTAGSGASSNGFVKNYTVGTGGVNSHDVVVLVNDGGNSRVVDTTISRDPRVMGVSFSTVASGNVDGIVIGGNTQVTADTGAVAIGDQLVTSTTSGLVTVDNNATTGILGYATTAKAGGSSGLVGVYVHPANGVTNPTFGGNVTIQGTTTTNTITPTGALTIGSTGQQFTLQGSSASTITGTGGGFTTTVGFAGAPTASQTYNFDRTAAAGTYTVCTTANNCSAGSTGIGGTGTINKIAKFTGANTLGNSSISDDGSSVIVAPATNSTTGFQVQNATGTNLLGVDTTTTNDPNLLSENASNFETGNAWVAKGTGATVSQNSGDVTAYSGSNTLKIVTGGTANAGAQYNFTFLPNTQYTFNIYARLASGSMNTLSFGHQDQSGTDIDCIQNTTPFSNGWWRYPCSFTTGPTISGSNFYVKDTGTGNTFYIDAVQLETGLNGTAFNPGGQLQLNGVINTPVALRSGTPTITALQVQSPVSNLNVLQVDTLRSTVGIDVQTSTGGCGTDLCFGGSANRTISVIKTNGGGVGRSLTLQGGQGAGANVGGNLVLEAGANGTAAGAPGTVVVQANGGDSTAAFQIQNSAATSFLTADSVNQIIATKDLNVGSAANTGAASRLFSDGFESNNFEVWSSGGGSSSGTPSISGTSTMATGTTQVRNGKYAAQDNLTGSGFAYIRTNFGSANAVNARAYVYVTSQGATNINLMSLTDAFITNNFLLYRDQTTGKLSFNSPLSGTTVGSTVLTTGAWHEIELDLNISGGTVNAYLDGTNVINLTGQSLAATNMSFVQIGDSTANDIGVFSIDDLAVDTVRPGDSSSLNVGDSLHVSGTATFSGVTSFQPVNNINDAFSIQNASNARVLDVDTFNNNFKLNQGNASYIGTNAGSAFSTTTSLPSLRHGGGVLAANGFVYYVGGDGSNVWYAKQNSDGTLGSWTATTSLPSPGPGSAYHAIYNGYIYVVGGNNLGFLNTTYYARINQDGSVGNWITSPQTLPVATQPYNAGVVANGYMYILGGNTGAGAASAVYYTKIHSDGSIGAWQTNTNSLFNNVGVYNGSAVVANGFVFLMGGSGNTAHVEKAQINSDGTLGAFSSQAISNMFQYNASWVADGNIYTLNAWDNTISEPNITVNSVSNTGTLGASTTAGGQLPTGSGTCYTQAAVSNGYIYIIGGEGPTCSADISTTYFTSMPRVQIGGSLDLVALNGNTMANQGSGSAGSLAGSLTAGNGNFVGSLQVQGAATLNQSLSVAGSLTAAADVTFANTQNSTNAFQIQNANGTTLLNVDTATSTNLLPENASNYEYGDAWTAKGTGSTVTQDNTQSFYGNYSSKIVTTGTANAGAQYPVTLLPNTTYALQFYVRSTVSASFMEFGRQEQSGTDIDCSAINQFSAAGGWIKGACTFTTGPTISSSNIYFKDTGTNHTFWVDMVSLRATAAQSSDAPNVGGQIQVNGLINSSLQVQNTANSNNEFAVYNAAGNVLFDVDSTLTHVGIGSANCGVDLCFGSSSNRTIGVSPVGAGVGKNLTLQASQGAAGNTGGNLILNAGAGGSGSTPGSVIVQANGGDSTNAFQVQNASASPLFVVDTATTTNLLPENASSFETGQTWTAKGTGATLTQDNTQAYKGTNSLKIATGGTANAGAQFNFTLLPSTTYTLSFQGRITSGSMTTLNFGRQEVSGTDIDCATAQSLSNAGWARRACTFTTGATITSSNIYIKDTGTNNTFYIDAVQLESNTNVGTEYNAGGQILFNTMIGSQVGIKNTSNSQTALTVQRAGASNTNVLQVDTLDFRVGINMSAGVPTTDLSFGNGSNRGINVNPASAGVGNNLTINAGQGASGNTGGNLILQGGANGTAAAAPGSVIVQANGGDSSNVFTVQNAAGVNVSQVGTATPSNYISDPDFSIASGGNPTNWTAVGSPTTFAQNTTASLTLEGQTSLQLVTSGVANQGAQTSAFTSAPPTAASGAGQFYGVSLYVQTTGSFAVSNLQIKATGGGNPTCTPTEPNADATTNLGSFKLLTCDLTFTSAGTITNLQIIQTSAAATTFYIDGVQLQQVATGTTVPSILQVGTTAIRGVDTAPLSIQTVSNTTNALTVQNVAGSTIFTVDTAHNSVGINTAATGGSALKVVGTTQVDTLQLTSSATGQNIQKNYATTTGNFTPFDLVVMVNDSGFSRISETTTSHDNRVMGVGQNTISGINTVDPVVIAGNTQVNVDSGAVNIGDQLVSSTTSGLATADDNATTGILGYATTAKAGGSNGTVGVYVRPVGGVNTPVIPGTMTISGTSGTNVNPGTSAISATGPAAGSLTTETLLTGQATNVGLTVQGTTSQTANLATFQDLNGVNLSKVDANGAYNGVGTLTTLGALQRPGTPGITVGAGGSSFFYVVTATNNQGETIASNAVGLTSDNGITISWTQVTGATGYKVYRHAGTNAFDSATCTGAGGCLVATITNGSTTSFSDSANALSAGSPNTSEAQNYLVVTSESGNALTVNGFGNAGFFNGINVTGQTGISGSSVNSTLSVKQVSNVPGVNIMGTGSANALQFQDINNGDILAGFSSSGNYTSNGTNQSHLGLNTPAFTTASTGSSFFYEITASNAQGETVGSPALGMANNTSTLNWTQISGATGYKIYRNTSNSFGAGSLLLTTINNGTTVSFTDSGAATGAGLPPTTPTGTGMVLQGWGSQTNNLLSNQDINGVTTSKIDANGNYNSNGTVTTVAALQRPTGVTANPVAGGSLSTIPYWYTVTATNSVGETEPAVVAATITPAGGNLSTLVGWNQVSGATGYKVYRNTANSFTSGSLLLTTITNGNTLSFTDTGAATNGTFPPTTETNLVYWKYTGWSGSTAATFDGFGTETLNNGLTVGGQNSASGTNTGLYVIQSSGQKGEIIRNNGAANTLEVQDNNGNQLSSFSSSGAFTTYGSNTNHLGLNTPQFTTASTGTNFYYEMTATNAQGETVGSAALGMVNNTSTLNWTQVPGATGYKIYRNTSNNFTAGSLLVTTLTNGSFVSYTDAGAATIAGLPPTAPTGTGMVLQGWSSQTANLLGAQDLNGISLTNLDANGNLKSFGTNNTLTALRQPSGVSAALAAGGSLTLSQQYFYTVTATNAQGESNQSPSVNATPVSGGTQSITVSWNQVAGATGYKLYRNTTNNFTAGSLLLTTITNGNTVSFNDTGTATVSGLPANSYNNTDVLLVKNYTGSNAFGVNGWGNTFAFFGEEVAGTCACGANAAADTLAVRQTSGNLGEIITGTGSQNAFEIEDVNGNAQGGYSSAANYTSYGTNQNYLNLAVPAFTTASTGTNFYYEITATNAQGETVGSAALGMANNTSTLAWTQVNGATGYKIYRHAGTNAFDSATCTGAGGCLISTITNGSTVSFTDAANALQAGAPPTTPAGSALTLQSWNGQNSAILAVQNASGTTVGGLASGGNAFFGTTGAISGSRLSSQTANAGQIGEVIKAVSGQTSDYLEFQDTSNMSLTRIDANGNYIGRGNNITLVALATPSLNAPSLSAGGSLTVGQIYYYVMTATNAQGETIASASVNATPTSGNQKVILTWPSISGATGYNIYRNTSNSFTSGSLLLTTLTTGGFTSTFTDVGNATGAGLPPTSVTGTGVTLQGWASQTGNVLQIQNAAAANQFTVDAGGNLTTLGAGYINTNSTSALNVEQAGTHNNVFTVDTTSGLVGIDSAPTAGLALSVGGQIFSTSDIVSSGDSAGNYQKNYIAGTGGVSANSVVVLVNDSSNSRVVNTTTLRDTRVMGVARTTVSSGSGSGIVIAGNTQVTADTGAVSIGDQLVTSSTSGQVTVDNNATAGILGYATTAKAGGSSGLVGVYVHPTNGVSTPNFSSNSTTGFVIQQTGGSALFTADTTNMKVTVTNLVVTADLTVNGHIISGGSTPGIAAGAAACTSPTVSINGDDTAGTITITTGTGCAGAGKLSTVTFATAFGSAPRVTLTPAGATAVGVGGYVDNSTVSTTTFDLDAATAPADTTTYTWNYLIVQ